MSRLKSRFSLNDEVARANRACVDAVGATMISLVGPAGSGKTSLIEALVARLHPRFATAAIIGNLAAERSVERIGRRGCRAIPVVADDLTAADVRDALSHLNLSGLDLVLIESEGSARRAVEFDLGQHLRASVFSIAGGDDKATEHPFLIAASDVVLLNKIDLLPLVTFDFKVFKEDVARAKPRTPIIQVSVQSAQGADQWVQWVLSHLPARVRERPAPQPADPVIRIPRS